MPFAARDPDLLPATGTLVNVVFLRLRKAVPDLVERKVLKEGSRLSPHALKLYVLLIAGGNVAGENAEQRIDKQSKRDVIKDGALFEALHKIQNKIYD